MFWFCVWQVISTLIELIRLGGRSASDKDLEILLLQHQLAIYERRQERAPHLSRGEKLMLIVLGTKLKAQTGRTIKQLGEVIRIVKPKTVFGWHRELVRWKWTYRQRNRGGRPRTDQEIERLVVRLARENGWGNERIEGELLKLGYKISDETVANILRRHGIQPVPERDTSPSWRQLIINQAHLRRVMREYIAFFNTARPHQGIDQQIPVPPASRATSGPVRCRKVLGGVLHDYYRDAA
jgi:hypothetical protein